MRPINNNSPGRTFSRCVSGSFCSAPQLRSCLASAPDAAHAQNYPNRADHAGDSIRAGRQHHDRRARHRRQDERVAGRKDRRRQPAGRRRHRRHQGGGEERARWLHHRAGLYRHARHRPLALQERRLRSAQGFCADRPDRQCAELAGGESVIPRQDHCRVDRLRQGQPRHGQFRLRRRRHGEPHHRRIFRSRPPASSWCIFPTREPGRR